MPFQGCGNTATIDTVSCVSWDEGWSSGTGVITLRENGTAFPL